MAHQQYEFTGISISMSALQICNQNYSSLFGKGTLGQG
jgi:hypothetical protein